MLAWYKALLAWNVNDNTTRQAGRASPCAAIAANIQM